VIDAVKALRFGERTLIEWRRPSGTTRFEFGMRGVTAYTRAIEDYDDSPKREPNFTAPGYVKEQRIRKREVKTIGPEAAARAAFERRKGRIVTALKRLPKSANR